jgi:penicillin-binding protein 1A
MVQAYTMFPGAGYNAEPFFINRIEDKNGNVIESFTPKRKKIIDEVTAYSVVSMMEGVIQRGTAQSMSAYNIQASSIAGKTGTTNDNSDLWFMGYTPQLLAGAWVGCDDRFLRFADNYFGQGARASLPIWAKFMKKVAADPNCNLDKEANFIKPANMPNDFNVDFVGKDSVAMDDVPSIIENVEDLNTEPIIIENSSPKPEKKPITKEPKEDKKVTKINKEANNPKLAKKENKKENKKASSSKKDSGKEKKDLGKVKNNKKETKSPKALLPVKKERKNNN